MIVTHEVWRYGNPDLEVDSVVKGRGSVGRVWSSGSHGSTYEQKGRVACLLTPAKNGPRVPLWQLHNMSELVVPGGWFEGREQDSWADAVPQRKLRMEMRK